MSETIDIAKRMYKIMEYNDKEDNYSNTVPSLGSLIELSINSNTFVINSLVRDRYFKGVGIIIEYKK